MVTEPAHFAFDADGVAASEIGEEDVAGEECGVVSEGFGWVEHSSVSLALIGADVELSSMPVELES